MIATIKEKKEIASDTLLVSFDLQGQEIYFQAGQFFRLTLISPPYTDAKGDSRLLGFVNSPSEADKVQIVTRIRDSAFKRSLLELPVGSQVDIGNPEGNILLPEDISRPLVFITGGIGIIPFISMLRYLKEKSLPYKITLVFSNQNQASAPFLNELTTIVKENPNLKLLATMTQEPDWPKEKRRIDTQFIKDYIQSPDENSYFITGTPRFVPGIFKSLISAGVTPTHIKIEVFTGY